MGVEGTTTRLVPMKALGGTNADAAANRRAKMVINLCIVDVWLEMVKGGYGATVLVSDGGRLLMAVVDQKSHRIFWCQPQLLPR